MSVKINSEWVSVGKNQVRILMQDEGDEVRWRGDREVKWESARAIEVSIACYREQKIEWNGTGLVKWSGERKASWVDGKLKKWEGNETAKWAFLVDEVVEERFYFMVWSLDRRDNVCVWC